MTDLDDAPLVILLLGSFVVRVRGQAIPAAAWRLRRAKTLVKLLALAPERRLHREQLVELLWPGETSPGTGLHQVLYTARQALGEEAATRLTLRDDVVALEGDGVWVDIDEFERAAATARAGSGPEAYRAALDLYKGELLPEDRYEDWAAARRESLRELHLMLLVELAQAQEGEGDGGGAVETLQRAVVEDPLHEPAHRALMRLFADDGRRQQALAQYQQLRQTLRRELEAEPDPETRRLYHEILAGQHEPPTAAAEAGATAAQSALPRQLTSFVGRERELSELAGMLGHARQLTLTGPGGCGKTRLALELATRCEHDFPDGARLVELAPITDSALVVEEAAAVLGVQLGSERDPVEVLAGHIGEQRLLLVLDNCEHLIDACARLADGLLRACPNVTVLATSRERLRVEGEVAWRVPSLSLPESGTGRVAEELSRSEAIHLFCRRAADVAPGFALTDANADAVAEVVRRLDGMPLALELAAARTAVLSPAQLAERLEDSLSLLRDGTRAGLTRQQTLRATLSWSHDLLGDDERVLYRRLGAFAGSFAVEAAEGVCADESIPADDVLPLLAELVNKSLVQVEEGAAGHRYRLLETVRQDARERLAAAGERGPVTAAHREWYAALAVAADRDVAPEVAATWSAEQLEADHDNLRAALASALREDPPAALRLVGALWWFWMARGYFAEAERWIREALAAAPEPTPERARALFAAAGIRLRLRTGHVQGMVVLGGEALEIVRRSGDRRAEARCLERLGTIAMGAYDYALADRAFAEGLALADELGDDMIAVAIKQAQGVMAGCRGENAQARQLFEESLALLAGIPEDRGPLFWATRISPVVIPAGPGGAPRAFFEDSYLLLRAARSGPGTGYVLCNIAEAWRSDGDDAAAREALDRALELFRDLGADQGTAVALNALGNLARSSGELEAGRAWFGEALDLRRAAGDRREIATTLVGMGLLALYAGDDAEGRRLIDEALGIFVRTDDGPGSQLVPLSVGSFELDRGDPERACALFERCDALSRGQGMVRNRAWASAELAEAALAVGDPERARRALGVAVESFEHLGEGRGITYANGLRARLESVVTGG